MNWDDLRFFIAVANASNITDAGQALKVSASTVSRKILVLEQALSSVLFLKTTQGYFLTEAGQALLPMALGAGAGHHQVAGAGAQGHGQHGGQPQRPVDVVDRGHGRLLEGSADCTGASLRRRHAWG